ncbi:MAG TPA: glutamyl-tRNA reductase [Anaerolineae bacterium]|nr:glutamyl-tRNA reductase [Anaerolineae bacterium]
MSIICLGLSYKTAPVQIRECLAFTSQTVRVALSHFHRNGEWQRAGLTELVIVTTCNRLEVYASTLDVLDEERARACRRVLVAFIAENHGMDPAHFHELFYYYWGEAALNHLMEVACGLDSMVLGEPQILGQMSEAYQIAQQMGTAGPVLDLAFRMGLKAGRRARAETTISQEAASISSVAVRTAQTVVTDWSKVNALVIGAGEMSALTVKALSQRGCGQVNVMNRTVARAEQLAGTVGGRGYSFKEMHDALVAADVVISSTGAPQAVLTLPVMQGVMAQREERPLVAIDIAVPRDIEEDISELDGIILYDIDHLQANLDDALGRRQAAIPAVKQIIKEQTAVFDEMFRGLQIRPLIKDLRQKAEDIRLKELDRLERYLPEEVSPAMAEQIERLSRSLVNKLLHEPTLRLRQEAERGRAGAYALTVRELFGLEEDEGSGRKKKLAEGRERPRVIDREADEPKPELEAMLIKTPHLLV